MSFDIEKMNKYQQTDILRILHNNNVTLNENKSGVFVNLSTVDDTIIEKLDKQIAYIVEQEHNIQAAEYQKEEYKNIIVDLKYYDGKPVIDFIQRVRHNEETWKFVQQRA